MLQYRVTQLLPLLPPTRRTAMLSRATNSPSRLKNTAIRVNLLNNHTGLRMVSSSMITSPSSGVVEDTRVTEVVTSPIMRWVLLFVLDLIGLVVIPPMQTMATATNTPHLITNPSLSRNSLHTVVNPLCL